MIVKPEHFEYLKIQHGKVGPFMDNFKEWQIQYKISLNKIYDNIKDYLPNPIGAALDIGGGFSGISTFIKPNYLMVIDGINDPPHRGGISNNALLAKDFLGLNGVYNVDYTHPDQAHKIEKQFDLIYSFASYSFHVAPDVYAENLFKNSHKDTVFIFEVRKGYTLPLKIEKVLYSEVKYDRVLARRS